MPPVTGVTNIQYYDTNGVLQTLSPATYLLDLASKPARIVPVAGGYWPMTRFQPSAVQVQYQSGDGNPPAAYVTAIKLLAAYWYQNREALILENGIHAQEIPLGVKTLLWTRRIMEF